MNTHPIQSHILQTILRSPTGIRYRDAKPQDTENDLYNYHLQYLVKQKLIIKNQGIYQLTDKGRQFIEEIYPINPLGHIADKFKVASLICLIRREKEKLEILYQTRGREPGYGFKLIPGGPISKGEPITETASRKLKEETGLTASFKLAGMIRKTKKQKNNEIFSDIFYFVSVSDSCSGQLIEKSVFGKNYWLPIEDAIRNELASDRGSKELARYFKALKTQDCRLIPFFTAEEII